MIRFAAIVLLLFILIACDKSDKNDVPQSLIDAYSNTCNTAINCKPRINLVKLDQQTFYGIDYQQSCEPVMMKVFYYPNGKLVDIGTEDYQKLIVNGEYQRVVWQCGN